MSVIHNGTMQCYIHSQILVTHHVEFVLPGTYNLVRMLDGRIDTKGTVKNLCVHGILDHIPAEVKGGGSVAAIETPIVPQKDNAEAERL